LLTKRATGLEVCQCHQNWWYHSIYQIWFPVSVL